MPGRNRYHKKKRKYTPRRKKRANNTNQMGYVSGMPKIRRAYLRYADTIQLTSTLGSLDLYQFRANSLFDPDLTSTGHQPMGFDQWTVLYNHYVVVGAKISIKSMAGDTTTVPSAICGCYISDDASLPYSTPDGFIEAKRGSWRTLSLQRNAVSFYTKFSTKKFFNITDVKDNVDRIGAIAGGNPNEIAIFNLWYANLLSNTSSQLLQITIDFIADFSEPKDLTQS